MRLNTFLGELKRRHVFRVAVMYGAAAVGVLAVASDVADAMELPGWIPRVVIFVTLLGFPVAVALAWAFDVTPEGVARTPEEPEPATGTPRPQGVAVATVPVRESALRGGPGVATLAVRVPRVVAPAPPPPPDELPSRPTPESGPPDPARVRRAALAHVFNELRSPIDAILGYSEMLMKDAPGRGETSALEDLGRIHQAGEELRSLVEGTLHPDRASLVEIERDAEGFGSRLRHDLRNPINAIIGYSEMLIEAGEETGDRALLPDLQRVLGSAKQLLRLTHEIVRFSGSTVDGEEPGAGLSSRAEVIAREALSKIQPLSADRSQARDIRPASLLVVDDNATNRDLLSRQLARQGYTVSTAENGREALEMLRTQDFDLVLLDILMPEVSGIEVLQSMQGDAHLRDVPVIMISALDEIDSVVRCIEMGAQDFLSKPFDPVLLGARIGACLEIRRMRDRERTYLEELQGERTLSERLLLSLFPAPVAVRLRAGEAVVVDAGPEATVLFAELEGSGKLAARGGPAELVRRLGEVFTLFDRLAEEHGIRATQVTGVTYVAAAGLPDSRADHAEAIGALALSMVEETSRYAAEIREPFRVRIGIHTGPLVAGVLQTGRLAYGMWGDGADTARAMEVTGAAGAIHVSPATYARLREKYVFDARGVIEVPGRGQMSTYLLRAGG